MTKNQNQISKAIETYRTEVEAHGLNISQHHDFHLLRKVCSDRDLKENKSFSLTEPFSVEYFDLSPETAFWIAVSDDQERVVSVQAARLDTLGRRSLAEHWRTQQQRIYVAPYENDRPELGDNHCPAAFEISGDVAYHGNMWLSSDWKGKKLGQPLCRLGQLIAYLKWDLDYIYCFIETALVAKGFAAHQGYSHIQPMGTDWIHAPSHIHADDYLCWNNPVDLDHLVRATNKWALEELSNNQLAESAPFPAAAAQ